MRAQLPETATEAVSVVACRLRGSETRRIFRPFRRTTNASTLPLVSPGTRFDADDRNATQRGRFLKAPSTAAPQEGPFAWPPLRGRETRRVPPGNHWVPSLAKTPARRTTKMSLTPLVSPATRSEASDSNAMTRAQRRSFEITGWVEGPFGTPPERLFEMRIVFCTSARSDAARAVGALAAAAGSARARRRIRVRVTG